MNAILKTCRLIGIAVGLAATVVVVGCSGDDSGLERRYKVSGTVKYKGELVPKGTVFFEPADLSKGRHASGYIENGSYSLTTAGSAPGDGALPGDYKVGIVASDLDLSGVAKATPGGMIHHGEKEHKEALKGAKSFVPQKYAQTTTSGLTAKVDGNKTINFDLTD
jgi:hypothetical protein